MSFLRLQHAENRMCRKLMSTVATGERAKACTRAVQKAAVEMSKAFEQSFIVGVTKDGEGFLYSWLGDVEFELRKQVILELKGRITV